MEISLLRLPIFVKGVQRQRGDGERWTNIVVQIMKKMLQDKSLLDEHWVKVTNLAIYLLNRSHNEVMIYLTPKEACTGLKQKVNCL